MEFPKRTLKVSGGSTYSYVYEPPSDNSKPYVLFLHGFPSLPIDHHHQISRLSSLGYGIIAPELLGYGDTSHPSESDSYRLKSMAKDVVDILDQHSVPNVVAIGHDWGVTLLSRLEFYHPERITKVVLQAIGVAPIGDTFDIDAVNRMMKEKLGYEGFGYMEFFVRDPDAAEILNKHQQSFRSLMFRADNGLAKQHFGAIGGLKRWLQDDQRTRTMESYTNDVRQQHDHAFSNEKGGYTGTLNWYKNHVENHNTPDEKAELKKRNLTTYQLDASKPLLQILGANDAIAVEAIHKQMTEAYAPHAITTSVAAGHWVMLEAADEVSHLVEEFLAT